ncbi:sporulation phosphorelay system protein KapB [Brevibacillus sp. B_LB10_24]|uniref:sporulation phosphorelay system protein KapB n=1 Tax=Brevibacillus sp. B_LB10_24 TaxID=3380645 RepID=UPI0038B92E0B
MQEQAIQVHQIVRVPYKSGQYLAEVLEIMPPKATVKILAVQKHPDQGDLHHPMQGDVLMFHQRRALSFQEKIMVPLGTIQPYQGEVPEYRGSLLLAVEQELARLREMGGSWAERSVKELEILQQEYAAQR